MGLSGEIRLEISYVGLGKRAHIDRNHIGVSEIPWEESKAFIG